MWWCCVVLDAAFEKAGKGVVTGGRSSVSADWICYGWWYDDRHGFCMNFLFQQVAALRLFQCL
jgi:hypothetical protein